MIIIIGALLLSMIPALLFYFWFRKMKKDGSSSVSTKDFGQAVAMGISNPMAIFIMFALFAFFGLANDMPHTWHVAPILICVSCGSVTYWFCISWLLSRFRGNFRLRTILWISRIAGAIVVIIGMALLGQGLFNVFFRGMPI